MHIRLLVLTVTLAVLTGTAVQAKPPQLKSAPAPATQSAAVRQFSVGASKITAGTTGNLIVMFSAAGPTAALTLEEGKSVSIPVAGKLGTVNLPNGSYLRGSLRRINESSGNFVFDALVINNKIYAVQATSAPVQGKLRADPYSLQTVQDGKDLVKAGIEGQRGIVEGAGASAIAGSTGRAVSAIGGTWGSYQAGAAIGAVGGIIGAIQQIGAVNRMADAQTKVLEREIPSVMVADLAPLQTLPVQFTSDVDLNSPDTILPPEMQQGAVTLPNAPGTPTMMYPVSPVGPSPVYPQAYPAYPAYPAPTYPGYPQTYPATPYPVPAPYPR